jgi:small GTP-binding protein
MSKKETESLKVVLLGDSGVGKTSIINRFANNIFESKFMSTLTSAYFTKTMKFDDFGGKEIKFELWDTAGQERYRSITKILFKDAQVIIFVYDITKEYSFNALKDYWYKETINCTEGTPLFAVAANKSDLYTEQTVNNKDGREFAEQINAIFQTTSAMSDTGINTLFENIGKKIIMPDYDYKNKDNTAEKNFSKKRQKEKEERIELIKRNSVGISSENEKKCC